MATYEYTLRKELFITIAIEAEDEYEANERYWSMNDSGDIDYIWRDEIPYGDTDVYAVHEIRDGKPYKIYGIE